MERPRDPSRDFFPLARPPVFRILSSLWRNQRLLKDFVVRDLKARYVGSSMGFFWSVVFPIINLCVYMFVFRLVLNQRFHDEASTTDVAVWMLAGITVWTAFAETLSRTTNCLVDNANLIQKVVFPSEVLPAYLVVSSLINMCIGLPIVLLGVLYFVYLKDPNGVEVAALGLQDVHIKAPVRNMGLGLSLLSLPLLFGVQLVFSCGLGYFLSAFNLFLRDTFHLIGVGTTVWMFATPIFYPAVMVEQGRGGQFAWILVVNPMHWLIECYRDVLVFGEWPNAIGLGKFALVATLTFGLGSAVFMRQKRQFPDLL